MAAQGDNPQPLCGHFGFDGFTTHNLRLLMDDGSGRYWDYIYSPATNLFLAIDLTDPSKIFAPTILPVGGAQYHCEGMVHSIYHRRESALQLLNSPSPNHPHTAPADGTGPVGVVDNDLGLIEDEDPDLDVFTKDHQEHQGQEAAHQTKESENKQDEDSQKEDLLTRIKAIDTELSAHEAFHSKIQREMEFAKKCSEMIQEAAKLGKGLENMEQLKNCLDIGKEVKPRS